MFERLGALAVRRRLWILALTLLGVIGAGMIGSGVHDHLSSGGYTDPDSESARAATMLDERFGQGQPTFVLIATVPKGQTVADPAAAQAGMELTRRLSTEPGVLKVQSFWNMDQPVSLRSKDGRSALALVRLAGGPDARKHTVQGFIDRYRQQGVLTLLASGSDETSREITETLKDDLVQAEKYALPITAVLLVLVFASMVAASLPLVIGLVAIAGTLAELWILANLTDVSVFALNVTTALGLGLGIDYSLFVVTRFREELARGLSPDRAVIETVQTAGRTVVYSAATVTLSLTALLVFPLYYLRSIAYAGIAVVVLAAVSTVVVLPAVLALLGERVNRLALFRRPPTRRAKVLPNFWERLAGAVMRRPGLVAVGVVAILLVLGTPFLHAQFGLPDDRALPQSASSRQAGDMLREDFATQESAQLFVVSNQRTDASTLTGYALDLSRLPGAARVDALTGSFANGVQVAAPDGSSARFESGSGTWLSIVPAADPSPTSGKELVNRLRSTPAPAPVLVGGESADLVDTSNAIADNVPWALAIIAVAVGILLFLFTGSVIVPLKALVLNLLSLSATFGAMVWIFQEGHLRWLLGNFTVTGQLDVTIPILMFCVAFGLSMDYEVFLLSRIREEWERTGDNTLAVARGLGHTGRLITATAAIIAVVFLSFATSSVTPLKLLGVGLALAVLMDATLVRGLLVPAFMKLTGRINWWAPPWLRRVHTRFGLREAPAPLPAHAEPPFAGPISELVLVDQYEPQGWRVRQDERLDRLLEECCDWVRLYGRPGQLAVDSDELSLTYDELDAQANQLARYLRLRGANPGDRIGLLFDEPAHAYIPMLAVFKIGAAYVPLDTDFPTDRMAYIVEDARVRTVLSMSWVAGRAEWIDQLSTSGAQLVHLDQAAPLIDELSSHRLTHIERGAHADQLAYISYTTDPTGRPAGVAIDHRSICNFIKVAAEVYGIRPRDRVYQGLSLAFDFSVEEILVPWLCGATLVPKPPGVLPLGADLHKFLVSQRVTAMYCVPVQLATLQDDLPDLRFLLVFGQVCPRDLIARWHRPGRRMLNVYGPAEATVTATWTELHPDKPVTIGVPLPTYSTVVLDVEDPHRALPHGETGEIGIAGLGLACGYLNRDDLTDNAFIPDFLGIPANPSGRIYRTGDLGRVNEDGEIEYLGRIDPRDNFGAYRIELAEIESALLRLPRAPMPWLTPRPAQIVNHPRRHSGNDPTPRALPTTTA
jgi:RND superfamily putative drug exporter